MKMHPVVLGTLIIASLWSNPSLAHHVMDGEIPLTFFYGLLSGLGHPVIGFDHLAFVIAVGLIGYFHQNRYLLPLAFLMGTLGGIVFQLTSFKLYLVEPAISGSVVLLGILALRAKRLPTQVVIYGFVITGIFHGYAYGSTILGAEVTPLVAYIMGLLAIQYAIAGIVIKSLELFSGANGSKIPIRVIGSIVLGIGLVFTIENLSTYSPL